MSSLDMESRISVLQETVDELMGRIAEMENRVGTPPKLTQMTVTDSGCRLKKTVDDKIENMDGEIKPVYINVTVKPAGSDSPATVAVPNPYLFYAAETVIEDDSQEVPAREVQIVLPVGGSLSGLYRFPRVGERILVAETDGGNFLMGYLPSSLVPFLDSYTESGKNGENILKTLEQKGEVLRYETRGASPSADNFSEIGFYSHEADWAVKEGEGKDKEFVYTDAEKTQLVYPLIDQLKLQSTGDIRSTAGNHHLIQAKRFEILAGCDEVNHRTDTTEDGERPLGDNLGDDSALHGGDVHIRAGNRVVIKAEQEICLQVGRTVLSLNDQGFTVKSKVTNSNFENVLDATLGLSPRDGINMFGYNVNVSSVKGFQISDSYGGSMTSSIGVVGVNGREIKLAAYDTMEYGFTMLYALFQLIQCSASGGAALGGAEDVNTAQYVNFTFDMVQRIIEVVKNVYEGYQARQKTKEIEDEKKASDRANADLERARTDAKKAAEERDAADKKLKEDAERAADSEQAARKAKEDADAKAKTAQEAAEQERQAKKKHEEDAAAEQKARADKDAADQEAARKKTEADDADQKAKAAKDQADSDAADAAKKKQEADDAQADADKAEKAADVDDKQIKALEERADANEESAADHAAKAAAAGKIVEAQTAILAAMVEQSNAIILKKNELDGLIAEQAGLIKDGKLRGKALAEAEAKLKSLKNELNITLQSEKTLELQITLESAKSHQAGEEVGNERRKAEEAQQSADQKKAEAEEAQRKSDADKAAAKDAQNNADTKKSEAEDAQTKADQSKKDSEDADSASKTSRKDSDDADAAAKKAAEANADAEADAAKSQREAEDAATDRTNKTTAAEEAEAEAAAKQAAKEADEQKLQTDMENLQNAEDAKEQADADLKAKEKAAEDAQKKYDAAVAATTSSALTDEFDQAVDVEGEKVLYEAPDYQPDPENQGGDGKSNEGGKNNDDVI